MNVARSCVRVEKMIKLMTDARVVDHLVVAWRETHVYLEADARFFRVNLKFQLIPRIVTLKMHFLSSCISESDKIFQQNVGYKRSC